MGWTFCRDWLSKQDVIDEYADGASRSGYDVQTEGNWIYAEKDGVPVDLIYLKTAKNSGEWGYKAMSVTVGPLCYTAPLWMVKKVHPVFKNDEYYQGWLEKYPKRKSVYNSVTTDPELFPMEKEDPHEQQAG
jgi:hypothetical protein